MENEITLAWYGNHINIIKIEKRLIGQGPGWGTIETVIETIKSVDHGGPETLKKARNRLDELGKLPEFAEDIKRGKERLARLILTAH